MSFRRRWKLPSPACGLSVECSVKYSTDKNTLLSTVRIRAAPRQKEAVRAILEGCPRVWWKQRSYSRWQWAIGWLGQLGVDNLRHCVLFNTCDLCQIRQRVMFGVLRDDKDGGEPHHVTHQNVGKFLSFLEYLVGLRWDGQEEISYLIPCKIGYISSIKCWK